MLYLKLKTKIFSLKNNRLIRLIDTKFQFRGMSVSERARRIQRQLAWRRARGADTVFEIDIGGCLIKALQQPAGEIQVFK